MIELFFAAGSDVSQVKDYMGIDFTLNDVWAFIRTVISVISIVTGVLFVFAGAVGVLRLPDFFTRMHAAGMTDTLGIELILLGLIIQSGLTLLSLKFFLVGFFLLLTSPTATHAIADAAYHAGLKPFLGRYKAPTLEQLRSNDKGGS